MKKLPIIILSSFFVCTVSCNSKAQQQTSVSAYTYRSASRDGIGKFYMGREIAKVMGASGSAWLDRATRPQEENTQLAIDKIDLPATAVIADIGAGTGYYTFKLAPKVPNGKVYAQQ